VPGWGKPVVLAAAAARIRTQLVAREQAGREIMGELELAFRMQRFPLAAAVARARSAETPVLVMGATAVLEVRRALMVRA
jgi:hypothetical protein